MLKVSNEKYKCMLGILEKTSQHIRLVTENIVEEIIPKLQKSNQKLRMIDIGAGAGDIAKNLQPYFDEIVAVEQNPEIKSCYAGTNINLKLIDFMNYDDETQYDLVLCSHALYHLNSDTMKSFITKLNRLTNSQGYIFIAMMAPQGRNHQFHKQLNPNYVNSGQVKDILEELEIQYECSEIKNIFNTQERKDIKNLLKFFAAEDCSLNSSSVKEIIIEQLEQCKNTENNNYTLAQDEDYIRYQKTSFF